jgi:hypothetical protein
VGIFAVEFNLSQGETKMVRKIFFAILAFALGSFGLSRVGGLPAKIGAYGAVAWAQDADDSGSDVSEPESKGPPPPHVAGPWCGSIKDNEFGPGTINLEVVQKRTKLSGSWSDTLGGNGTIKGKINGDAITATLKQRGTKCKVALVGSLVAPDEVSGSYSIFGCHESDGGSFDITSPSC